MLLSLNWLKEFVDIKYNNIKEFSELLTLSGSKVESFRSLGDEIEKVVVGKIMEIKKHPDAEKLIICLVDIGEELPLQIVTGATNVFEGAIVPVACHNAKLPNGVKIKKTKLRGVKSEGMLCSLEELGLEVCNFPYAEENGIFVIKEECTIGQDISTALALKDEVIDFEITSNRTDCFSIMGISREAAATYNTTFKEPQFDIQQFYLDNGKITAKVLEPALCYRYMLHLIKGVNVSYSPLWLRARLNAVGIRPINNIVDITNYVLMELGQPMHAFDADKIEGKICVRKARNTEEILTLDGALRKLDNSMLVIADEKKVLAIAGVMGGALSAINEKTKNIIFESAVFDSASIRKTAKKLNLRSESSARFEKGLPSTNCPNAIARACELISKLNVANPCGTTVDIINRQEKQSKVKLEYEKINQLLGTNLSEFEINGYLKRLGFKIFQNFAIIPEYRTDIENIADIAEEVARLYDYNNISSEPLPEVGVFKKNSFEAFKRELANLAVAGGFYEIITYSMISPKHFEKMLISETDSIRNAVKIRNPLGEDKSIMRTTTIPSMLEILSYNFNQKNNEAFLFDMGCEYIKHNFKDENGERLVDERSMLTLGAYEINNSELDFFYLKGIVCNILDKIGIKDYNFISDKEITYLHPGRAATISSKAEKIGLIGQIHPIVAKNYELCENVLVAKLDIVKMFELAEHKKVYKPVSKYPAVLRDLAFVCEKKVPIGFIESVIKNELKGIIEEIKLLSVYEGKQIPAGEKSVAFSLKLRSTEKTLDDEYIDKVIIKVLKELEKNNIVLR